MATPEPAAPSSAEFVTKMIWASLLASHLIYVGLIYFLKPPLQAASPLVLALTAAAILDGAAALLIDAFLLGEGPIEKWIAAQKAQGVTGQDLEARVMARGQSMSIVCWALAESVTLMGMVLAFTGQQSFQRFLFFVAGGVAIHLYCRPKLADLRESVRRSS